MDRLYKIIKIVGIWAISVLLVASCGIFKPVVLKDSTVVNYHYVDSINYIDSTILVPIYKEYYRDYSDLLDTLNLETSLAQAKAYVDTTDKKLKGEIQNKNTQIPYKTKYKEKISYKDSLVYIRQDVPVYVEKIKKVVPSWCWWLLSINIAMLLAAVFFLLKKLKIFCFN